MWLWVQLASNRGGRKAEVPELGKMIPMRPFGRVAPGEADRRREALSSQSTYRLLCVHFPTNTIVTVESPRYFSRILPITYSGLVLFIKSSFAEMPNAFGMNTVSPCVHR